MPRMAVLATCGVSGFSVQLISVILLLPRSKIWKGSFFSVSVTLAKDWQVFVSTLCDLWAVWPMTLNPGLLPIGEIL